MGLVVYASSNPFRHQHLHFCFYCKKRKREDNAVCRRDFDHDFPCYDHIEHFRSALGMLDSLVDFAISEDEKQRFEDEWT